MFVLTLQQNAPLRLSQILFMVMGVFDFSSLTKSFVTYDFPGTASEEGGLAVHQALNSFVLVDAIFREEYTSGSTFFSPTGGTQSNSAFYINSSLPFADSVTSPSLDAYTASNKPC